MSDRVEAAVAELAAALREELRAELAESRGAAHGRQELLSIAEAARRLGVGRSLLYSMIGTGQVRTVKLSRRRLVPADALADVARAAPPLNGTAQEVRDATAAPTRAA